jgi:hypothetical protein
LTKFIWDRPYRGMDESGSQLDQIVNQDLLAKGKSRRNKPRKEEGIGTAFVLSSASGLVHVGAWGGHTLCGFAILAGWTSTSRSRATCLKCKRLSASTKGKAPSPNARGLEKKNQKSRSSESSMPKIYFTLTEVRSLRVSRVLDRVKDRRQFFITAIQGDIYVMTPTKRSKRLGELKTTVTSEKLRRQYRLPVESSEKVQSAVR